MLNNTAAIFNRSWLEEKLNLLKAAAVSAE
jgi:hypothetical protein